MYDRQDFILMNTKSDLSHSRAVRLAGINQTNKQITNRPLLGTRQNRKRRVVKIPKIGKLNTEYNNTLALRLSRFYPYKWSCAFIA